MAQQGPGPASGSDDFARQVAPLRRELLAHCYRLSGSLHDAEDLLQEALTRAWKAYPAFEARASLRTWLYRIATNVCLDALDQRRARALPETLGPPADPSAIGRMAPSMEPVWLEPYPDALLPELAPSPEAEYTARESVALAFLVALQTLPARQRAALLLHDVVGFSAPECAEALASTPAAVNSAVQRAREALQGRRADAAPTPGPLEADDGALLERYLRAWEDADVETLVMLLADDALFSMPPLPDWLLGPATIAASLRAMVLLPERRGHFRLLPVEGNGLPGFATYLREPAGSSFRPLSIQLLSVKRGRIQAVHAFLDPTLFQRFGLPPVLDAG